MLGIPLGLLYANWGEWMIHKHLLHGRGKKKDAWAAFHWYRHHKNARRNGNRDVDFEEPWFEELKADHDETGRTKELYGLAAAALVHMPLFPVAPFFTTTVVLSIANYYRVHKRSHQDPEWARQHLPWHVDHHLGPNQHANWCVTWPWFDHIMGTREPYVGTEREAQDRARHERNRQRRLHRERERREAGEVAAAS